MLYHRVSNRLRLYRLQKQADAESMSRRASVYTAQPGRVLGRVFDVLGPLDPTGWVETGPITYAA